MWKRVQSIEIENVSPEKIWEIWTDVNNWEKWHGDLDYCKLEGEFKVGNFFRLKPKGVK